MPKNESVTEWMLQLQDGNQQAAERLWERFFRQMTKMAKARLRFRTPAIADEEDIALSAFHSFCMGMQNGRFDELQGRDGLWRLLVVITSRKAADQHAFDHRKKRDVAREVSLESDELSDQPIVQLMSREPTPQMEVELSEQLAMLLGSLQREDLKHVALLKMEGYANEEIAEKISKSLSTVERKLRTIRTIWKRAAGESDLDLECEESSV